MKKHQFSILISLLFFLGSQISNSQTVNIYDRPKQTEHSHNYDAIHYRIKLEFDEKSKSFKGENRITLTPHLLLLIAQKNRLYS
ncbi:hypothetical protein IIC38_10310 [candidate division KSB1 bacterium]|nr:hypothetical protein [candidate division KSB1 bacterium]